MSKNFSFVFYYFIENLDPNCHNSHAPKLPVEIGKTKMSFQWAHALNSYLPPPY